MDAIQKHSHFFVAPQLHPILPNIFCMCIFHDKCSWNSTLRKL